MKIWKLPVVALAMCALPCFAQTLPAQQPFSQQSNPPATVVELSVPDVELVNQSGERVHFKSDVIKGRVAVITSFLTNCASFCPITQEKLAQLSKVLGDKMGRDVVFISVSVDPENDTPEKMKAWGEKFHIQSGWNLVSGKKDNVESLLKSLGLYVSIPQRHQSALLIGNQKSGWSRVSSWSTAEKLARIVDEHERAKPGSAAVDYRDHGPDDRMLVFLKHPTELKCAEVAIHPGAIAHNSFSTLQSKNGARRQS